MECGGFMYWKKILSPCDVCFTSDHNLFLNALHFTGGFCLFEEKIEKMLLFIQVNLCQKLLFLHQLTHKQLFIELRVQYMKITSSEHVVYINCSECQNKNNLCTQHVLSMYWTRNSMKNLLSYCWCKNKCFWKRFTCTAQSKCWLDFYVCLHAKIESTFIWTHNVIEIAQNFNSFQYIVCTRFLLNQVSSDMRV